jgi:gliding motility-associated-like protein
MFFRLIYYFWIFFYLFMKNTLTLLCLLILSIGFAQNHNKSIGFIENKGQIIDQKGKNNSAVKYLLCTNGLNVQLRQNGFSYDVFETRKSSLKNKSKKDSASLIPEHYKSEGFNVKTNYHRVDIDFIGSNPNAILIAEDKSRDFENFYNNPSKPEGFSSVFKFQKVTYQNIYPNIDVVFFVPEDKSKPVEYNFIVKSNGNINDIQLKFTGAKTELIDSKIKMDVCFGTMEETIPLSWNENDKKEVAISYKKINKNTYGFQSFENLNNKTIIIDPVPIRLWGTYYGGSNTEYSNDMITNNDNDVYLTGYTESPNNIATAGTHLSAISGNSNLFFVKFDTNGNRLWGTYFLIDQGNFNSHFAKMATDSQNNFYFLTGELYNSNVATSGAHQTVKSNYNDVILGKLNNSGIREWVTYYGGNGNEYAQSICVDSSDNVYIGGDTTSSDALFTVGAHQTTNHSQTSYSDGYLAKFNPNGDRLWATFYGGVKSEGFMNLLISNDGFLYATGISHSDTDIATPGAYQSTNTSINGSASMIIKFDLSGQRIWGTYIANDSYMFYAKLKGDNLYFSGPSFTSTGIATPGTYMENYQTAAPNSYLTGLEIGYVMSFNVQTQQKNWGTYYQERINSIGVNQNEEVYFSGDTRQANGIATPDAYIPNINSTAPKCYLIKMNSSGQRLWGTYYGGNLGENLGRICIDQNNDIYLMGFTSSTSGIATTGAHQTTRGSNPDCFIVKFRDCFSTTSVNSNSPTCAGSTLNLTASGGTGYAWTGPNGFTSNQQNLSISNVTTANSGLYSCSITGSASCDNTISINVFVGDTTSPIPSTPVLPTVNGDCNVVITIPTATDNCSGLINGTTTNPSGYPLPGTYNFVWTYTDASGNTETQNQTVIINPVALPTVNSPQTFCIQQNATLNNITITGQNIHWYDAQTGGNVLSSNTVLQNGITYYASQTSNSCESSRVPVTVSVQNTSAPTGNGTQSFCALQNPTLNDFAVNGTSINWYNSTTSTTILPTNTLLVDGTTYYATQTINGCESVNRLPVTVSLIFSLNANDYTTTICDQGNNGTELVDLSQFNSNLLNGTGNTFTYYQSFNGAENQIAGEQFNINHTINIGLNTIFVRIDSANGCHQIVVLELTLVSVPVIPIADEIILCERSVVTVNAGSGFNSYLWSTNATSPSITINQAGSYSVTVTKNHGTVVCSSAKNFTVTLSNAPTITSIDTVDWTDNENSITVNANGLGDYEYSIDGINFQNSNVFNGLPNGNYTVTVKDKKECGEVTEQVYLLNYPKFFTPNGDGNNDGWKIKFSQYEPNFEVRIFDRYGKLLKIMYNNEAWDGNYNGRQMPSDDYWFNVIRNDGRTHKGHFAMIR